MKLSICYFYYLKNIRKFLVKEGYTCQKYKEEYDILIKFASQILFEKNIYKNFNKVVNKIFIFFNIFY